MIPDKTVTPPEALLIRGTHPAGNMVFRLERLNLLPVPDDAVLTLVQSSGLEPTLPGLSCEELAAYITEVIRQSSPDITQADVWARMKAPLMQTSTPYPHRVISEDAFKDWQMVQTFMKNKPAD